MTFRAWLGKQIRELAADPTTASPPSPQSSSPGLSPSSPTLNGKGSVSSSADLAMLERVLDRMATMQQENLREVRGMVMDILQGREYTGPPADPLSEEVQEQLSRTRFDPPNYDAPGTEDLPEGLAAVWARHDEEDIHFQTSKSPGELLNEQLERARRAAGMDPQGPASVPSFSTESLGLQWPGQGTT